MQDKPTIDTFQKQLYSVIVEYEAALSQSKYDDASDILSDTRVKDLQTRTIAAIERISGRNSIYFQQATKIDTERGNNWDHLAGQIGVAKSLLSDIQNDYLKSLEEIIHGDIFGDFLEMADHLLENGYKDASAILAGSTLEVHIKKLCDKYGIDVSSNGKVKKSDLLNAELAKKGAYTKLDQKNITAWLGLRNNAAHGNYSEYTKAQVQLFSANIRDFITRNPA